jgi:ABC-2 type transport system ATP-binding protein
MNPITTDHHAAEPIIRITDLSKRFGPLQAVDRLSFAVERGKITGFLGPNGAGKTTTLRMLLGLVKPSTGRATINGLSYAQLDRPSQRVGAVLEASSIHPGRTARQHLRLRALAGGAPRDRVDEVLSLVDLSAAANKRVRTFSLGMKQRLNLAAALLGNPDVLILDEPTNGLDPEGVQWLRSFLKGLAAEGHTVLVSSHLLMEVSQIVDNVVILNRGRLVTQASLRDLLATAGSTDLEKIFFTLIEKSNATEDVK